MLKVISNCLVRSQSVAEKLRSVLSRWYLSTVWSGDRVIQQGYLGIHLQYSVLRNYPAGFVARLMGYEVDEATEGRYAKRAREILNISGLRIESSMDTKESYSNTYNATGSFLWATVLR